MAAILFLLAVVAAPPPNALATLRRERAAAEARASMLDRAAAAAQTHAERVAATAAALALRVQASEIDVAAARRTFAATQAARRRIAIRIAAERAPLARLVAAQARIARRPAAAALAATGSIEEAGRVRALLVAAVPAIARRTATLRADLAAADRLRDTARRALTDLRTGATTLDRRRAALALAERRARDEGAVRAADAEHVRADALDLADREATLAALAGRIDREAAAAAELATLPAPPPRPSGDRERFPAPPTAIVATTLYRLPVLGATRVAATDGDAPGLALATTPGGQAVAPAAGRVAYAGPFRRYGGVVILDHGRGWTSVIAGLATATATAGAIVPGGGPIGRTGARLTVELRHFGRPVDVARMAQLLS